MTIDRPASIPQSPVFPNIILLDIVDPQDDFILTDGACTHPRGAGLPLVPLFNAFFKRLSPEAADLILVKYDTHFTGEYPMSEEAKLFPTPHCLWNTAGQKLTVNLNLIDARIPLFHMNKNVFSMWGDNPIDIEQVPFQSAEERLAYQNLFHVTRSFNQLERGTPRDAWLKEQNITPQTATVVVAGIYADYCTRDAIEGYLKRGFNVIALTDLTAGIGGNPDRSGLDLTGDLDKVCDQAFNKPLQSGQLRLMTAEDFLKNPRSLTQLNAI